MDWWMKLYLFEVEFEDGSTLLQSIELPSLTDETLRDRGQAVELRLVPQRTDLNPHSARIPKGTRPVYFRRNDIAVGVEAKGLRFCIGWVSGGDRPQQVMFCNSISAKTGATQLLEPEAYRGQ